MAKLDTRVEKSETGYSVFIGDTCFGVHKDQASSEKEAIEVAKPQYEEWKKFQPNYEEAK